MSAKNASKVCELRTVSERRLRAPWSALSAPQRAASAAHEIRDVIGTSTGLVDTSTRQMDGAARSALSQLLAEPFSPRCRQNARQLLDQKPPAKPAAPRAPKQPTSTS